MEQETAPAPLPEKETKARERAQVILDVRSGKLTMTDGATLLNISRQRLYELEHRALSAMTDALVDGEAGRPEKPMEDPEKADLKRKVSELEREVMLLRQSAIIRDELYPLPDWRPKAPDPQKKRLK